MARGDPGRSDEPEREALPFADYALRQAHNVEARLLAALRRRMDELASGAGEGGPPRAAQAAQEAAASECDPGVRLARLLDRSLEQREEAAERELLQRCVDQLCCDEARIIAALSDRQSAVACQVGAAFRVGLTAVPVLRYASRVGVEAGVMLRAQVPTYIAHLIALGLIETAPEDREQGDAYAMLMSDEIVCEAIRHIRQDLKLQARVRRFSLRLSALGRRLWARADRAWR